MAMAVAQGAVAQGQQQQQQQGWCVHGKDTTCARWCLRTFAKCFVVGSGAKTLLNVLVFVAFRRGRGKALTPRLLLHALLDVRYGLFLGTYSAAWKLVSCLARTALLSAPATTASQPPRVHRHQQQQQDCSAAKGGHHAPTSSSSSSGAPSLASSGSEVAALPGSLARPCSSLALTSSATSPEGDEDEGEGVESECSSSGGGRGAGEGGEATVATATMAARDRYALWAIDIAAGAASGLALYWLPKSDRKGLALYFFTRSGEFLARFLSSHRLLPPLLERLAPHVDVALMTLSASQILFSYIMERDTLDPTYSSFLIKFGGKDVRVIDSIAPLRKGGKLNRAMFMEWAREHQLKDVMGVLFGLHHYKICDVVHPDSDCVTHFTGFTYEAFWRAFPMYATLHSLTTIIFLLSKLRSFVVAHGYHRRYQTRSAPRGGINTEPATISMDGKTQSLLAAGSTAVEDGGLALHRDDSMRALHWSPSPPRHIRTRQHLGVKQEEHAERRRLSAGEVGRMVSYCVSNLCAYLRTPSHVWALLRFVFSQVLPKLVINVVRSSLFLGLYCASGWLGACLAQRSFLMKDVRWFYPVLALPGLASIIEVPARRRELALYCLPKAMESCYAVCKKYDVIPRWLQYFKNGEVFLFSVGSALTLFCYVNGKESIKPTFLSLMNWLWA